ncbi:MAG: hypothetical protein AAGI30_06425 [Planctomycetota bacterium]
MKHVITTAAATLTLTSHAAAAVIYSNDFESTTVGSEWDQSSLYTHAIEGQLLGKFGDETANLTLDTIGGQQYTVTFDLFVHGQWEGLGESNQDHFQVFADSTELLTAYIDYDYEGSTHTFIAPSVVYNENQGINQQYFFKDVTLDFTADDATTVLSFIGYVTKDTTEYWGLDNVRVTSFTPSDPIPSPGPIALLAVGCAAVLRRKARC